MTTSIPAEELLAGDAKHLTLLDDGVELKALGARRLAADAFLRAYLVDSSAWRWRYLFLRCYSDILLERQGVTATDADVAALRGIAKDRRSTVIERFHTQYMVAFALNTQGKYDEAMRANTKALRIAEAATEQQRAELVPTFVDNGARFAFATVAEHMDEQWRPAKVAATGARFAADAKDGEYDPLLGGKRVVMRSSWPQQSRCAADKLVHAVAIRRAMADRSIVCSQCGGGAEGGKLLRCGTCRRACYCSRACQRANWAVHKLQCRAPGEHRVGDIVHLVAVHAQPELNGDLAQVEARDASDPRCWVVFNTNWSGGQRRSVPQESLRCVLTH